MADDFVVNDKRLFSKDGQVKPEGEESVRPSADASPRPSSADEKPRAAAETEPAFSGAAGLPPANFAGLLLGLATSAFIHLGEGPEPDGGQVDLAAAKHAIDLLGVLQAKTQGNLEEEEASLLTTLLYDLRMKFVKASGR
ncbi:MAG: DUF1844 domain-containing protein [Candidatus Adiutrix sp.]|jgi:hypothetical protein|nr:DUF1844 domain-containing protein [Candidatus Adiutrix sp.]